MDRYVKQILSMAQDGAGVEYISRVSGESVDCVQAVIDGRISRLEPDPTPRPKSTPKRKRPVPVTRPFPALPDDMTDGQRIIVLTRHGLSAQKIRRYLMDSTTSVRRINSYARKILGPPRTGNNSEANHIHPDLMPYIHICLELLGKDRYTCEICLDLEPDGCQVHHTKYEGATIYDLMYVCMSCNLARENKGLV